MLPRHRIATHPGEILLDEFLVPLEISRAAFARHIGVPGRTISAVVRGERALDARLAWLLSGALETSPEFWMTLQSNHDLTAARPKRRIRPLRRSA